MCEVFDLYYDLYICYLNIRLTDELVFSLMHSSSIVVTEVNSYYFNQILSFIFCTRPMYTCLFTSTRLVVSPLTLHTVSDIHINIYIFSACTSFKQLFVKTTYSLCIWIRKMLSM